MADSPTEETAGSEDEVAKGLRLVKAFQQISDPTLRDAIVEFAERIAQSSSARGDG